MHGRVERWFVLRPNRDLTPLYLAKGLPLPDDCRVVVDAKSLRPLGVLPDGLDTPSRALRSPPPG